MAMFLGQEMDSQEALAFEDCSAGWGGAAVLL